jgi:hypothetical protein
MLGLCGRPERGETKCEESRDRQRETEREREREMRERQRKGGGVGSLTSHTVDSAIYGDFAPLHNGVLVKIVILLLILQVNCVVVIFVMACLMDVRNPHNVDFVVFRPISWRDLQSVKKERETNRKGDRKQKREDVKEYGEVKWRGPWLPAARKRVWGNLVLMAPSWCSEREKKHLRKIQSND